MTRHTTPARLAQLSRLLDRIGEDRNLAYAQLRYATRYPEEAERLYALYLRRQRQYAAGLRLARRLTSRLHPTA